MHCQVQEVGGTGSITAIQVKGPESDWEGMENKWGAAWEIVHAPVYPLDIHLTNDQGQEVQRSHMPSLEYAFASTHAQHKLSSCCSAHGTDTASYLPGLLL